MGIQCDRADLVSESDVEQKFIYPLLTLHEPEGLGFSAAQVRTKIDIRRLRIGKGQEEKLYYPDYVLIMNGLPILIVEAKAPSENPQDGLREARLYAVELNSDFPAGINPVVKIIVSNGLKVIVGATDSNSILLELDLADCDASNLRFAQLLTLVSRQSLELHVQGILKRIVPHTLFRPINMLGGSYVRNEEIPHNTFGDTLRLQFRHIFNPATDEERAFIARNAYIPSKRRERYLDPINKVIRAALPPSTTDAKAIDDTERPDELWSALKTHKLENQILILIGGKGAGKSTFVDYIRAVSLPAEVKIKTHWLYVNMNVAPVQKETAYSWVCSELIDALESCDDGLRECRMDSLLKLYSVEAKRIRGLLSLLDADSQEYRERLTDEIRTLQKDLPATLKALARYLCAERGRLLVIVLDNCDKRTTDEQLLMFEITQWLQKQIRCLIVLPMRDITYDHHRNEPPLDTTMKDLVFRIDPPQFYKVLARRISLALDELNAESGVQSCSYELPNGMTVTYPASDQGMYLSCMLQSFFKHESLIRELVVGLAGKDIRLAMEMFLELCTSGHIGEDEIFRIREYEGNYSLSYHKVVTVLLRLSRKYYDGDAGYLKNLFQARPKHSIPSNFIRLAILRWLRANYQTKGPTGIMGYHRTRDVVASLVPLGFEEEDILEETLYLMDARCVYAEHLETQRLDGDDLISLAPAGFVHLKVAEDTRYLAACAEDTWVDDERLATDIANTLGFSDYLEHWNGLKTASQFINYLDGKKGKILPCPDKYLGNHNAMTLLDVSQTKGRVDSRVQEYTAKHPVRVLFETVSIGDIVDVTIGSHHENHGVFVKFDCGFTGLLAKRELDMRNIGRGSWPTLATRMSLRISDIDRSNKKIYLTIP